MISQVTAVAVSAMPEVSTDVPTGSNVDVVVVVVAVDVVTAPPLLLCGML
jgi:hypothetical protein